MVVQAALFICVNVLIEDCRSGQCETREKRVLGERREDWGKKKWRQENVFQTALFCFFFGAFINHKKTIMGNDGNVVSITIFFHIFHFIDAVGWD